MAKIINISDKLSNEKNQVQIGEKFYDVDDSMQAMIKFEELITGKQSIANMNKAIEVALGLEAANNTVKWSLKNFKVLIIAILAAMQDIEYEEAEKRFRKAESK